ncbi:hypothetical protein Tco_0860796 [Tanacetum coccineum]|uniref:Uncharacterized protein n=1 Tax=Tanacetum coccineum TaxID=301880 RepID=A0ABQ5BK07_9ASTR
MANLLPRLQELATAAKSTMMVGQVLMLMKREIDKELKHEEKFRELCLRWLILEKIGHSSLRRINPILVCVKDPLCVKVEGRDARGVWKVVYEISG